MKLECQKCNQAYESPAGYCYEAGDSVKCPKCGIELAPEGTQPPEPTISIPVWSRALAILSIALATLPLYWGHIVGSWASFFVLFWLPSLLWSVSVLLVGLSGPPIKRLWWVFPFGVVAWWWLLFLLCFYVALKLNGGNFAP